MLGVDHWDALVALGNPEERADLSVELVRSPGSSQS
jgi:hypothetical protein